VKFVGLDENCGFAASCMRPSVSRKKRCVVLRGCILVASARLAGGPLGHLPGMGQRFLGLPDRYAEDVFFTGKSLKSGGMA
jgi:hypothetical protein